MIPGFVTYKTFLAVKNHFILDGYNYAMYNGKISATVKSYLARADRMHFEKLGRMVNSEEELRDWIVGNMSHSNTTDPKKLWIGSLTTAVAKNRALDYMAKKQALDYFVKKDLTTVAEYVKMYDRSPEKKRSESDLPLILSLYYDNLILPETVIILDRITNGLLFEQWTKKQGSDPLWAATKKFLYKYSAITFMNVELDLRKYRLMYKEALERDDI